MKIKTYRYEKFLDKETEILVPEKPFYCFQTFIRRAIRIIPSFVTWDAPNTTKGDLFELEVTCVYQSSECKVEKFTYRVSDMEGHINNEAKSKEAKITKMLLEEDYFPRTEEQFNIDLDTAIKTFK